MISVSPDAVVTSTARSFGKRDVDVGIGSAEPKLRRIAARKPRTAWKFSWVRVRTTSAFLRRVELDDRVVEHPLIRGVLDAQGDLDHVALRGADGHVAATRRDASTSRAGRLEHFMSFYFRCHMLLPLGSPTTCRTLRCWT